MELVKPGSLRSSSIRCCAPMVWETPASRGIPRRGVMVTPSSTAAPPARSQAPAPGAEVEGQQGPPGEGQAEAGPGEEAGRELDRAQQGVALPQREPPVEALGVEEEEDGQPEAGAEQLQAPSGTLPGAPALALPAPRPPPGPQQGQDEEGEGGAERERLPQPQPGGAVGGVGVEQLQVEGEADGAVGAALLEAPQEGVQAGPDQELVAVVQLPPVHALHLDEGHLQEGRQPQEGRQEGPVEGRRCRPGRGPAGWGATGRGPPATARRGRRRSPPRGCGSGAGRP